MATKKGKGQLPAKVEQQRREVMDAIKIEMGSGMWHMPWNSQIICPQNPISGTKYTGGNRFGLFWIAKIRGYDDPRWATFKQIQDAGYKLKKGAKAAVVERWKEFSYAVKDDNAEDADDVKMRHYLMCIGYWNVFNFSEVEGAEPFEADKFSWFSDGDMKFEQAYVDSIDRLVKSSRCPIVETLDGEAYYDIRKDEITMPARKAFTSAESFMQVLAHEMCHSTAKPLKRDVQGWFGTPKYAFEELIAELGSAFIMSGCGFYDDMEEEMERANIPDVRGHARYISSWLSALDDDLSYFYRAATQAQKAADFVLDRMDSVDGSDGQYDNRKMAKSA